MDFSRILSRAAEGFMSGRLKGHQINRQNEEARRRKALLALRRRSAERADESLDLRREKFDEVVSRRERQENEEAVEEAEAMEALKQRIQNDPELSQLPPDVQESYARAAVGSDDFDASMIPFTEDPSPYNAAQADLMRAQAESTREELSRYREQDLLQGLASDPTAAGMMKSVAEAGSQEAARRVAEYLSSERGGGYDVDPGFVARNARRFTTGQLQQGRQQDALELDTKLQTALVKRRARQFAGQFESPDQAVAAIEEAVEQGAQLTEAEQEVYAELLNQQGQNAGSDEMTLDDF